MRNGFLSTTMMVALTAAAVSTPILASITRSSAQAQAAAYSVPSLRTPWDEPDLQGIWTDEANTPLQRPATYATQEFFTEAQRIELDSARTALPGKDRRAERGTEIDVTGSYNQAFLSRKRTGARTSLIVDPQDGRLPPLTPEAQKMAAAEREYRLALMQATETCKIKYPTCSGGKYDPMPSPRRAEPPLATTQGV
ncbi:MAG TPA: hypothetical protein VKC66_01715 [Xanthobacteraceae bacterium]|nr:hypothetical protein [Xanthobacteraceae bacterium]